MTSSEIYNWWLRNKGLNNELVEKIQLECFNKRVEPVKTITSDELNQILNSDQRFNNPKVAFRFYWIFDTKYAVISSETLYSILSELRDIHNPWTIVAIVQSTTGLNCGFIAFGRRVENGEFKEEHNYYGFLTEKGVVMFDENNEEVSEDGCAIWHLVFD